MFKFDEKKRSLSILSKPAVISRVCVDGVMSCDPSPLPDTDHGAARRPACPDKGISMMTSLQQPPAASSSLQARAWSLPTGTERGMIRDAGVTMR